jgi:hypothetical protein
MKRIKPGDVLAAFRGLNMKPIQRGFFRDGEGGRDGCCGLSAIGLATKTTVVDLDFLDDLNDAGIKDAAFEMADTLELDRLYAEGFIEGWDGNCRLANPPEYQDGYDDGEAARLLVYKELQEAPYGP